CAPSGRASAATLRRAPRPPFPPGGSCASSRATRSSRPSLAPLPPADEPGRRETPVALQRPGCCPAPGREQGTDVTDVEQTWRPQDDLLRHIHGAARHCPRCV